MKKKIHKLAAESNESFILIGIVSHENDYRLSWAFNQQIGLKLIKSKNIIVSQPKLEENPIFAVFKSEDEESLIQYYLITNKSEYGYLVPELKNVDYILKICGESTEETAIMLLNQIKKVEFVIAAFLIEGLPAKSLKNLIF
ncbi:MAG: IPExxxVDY family protein [Bacteroidales bacterium]